MISPSLGPPPANRQVGVCFRRMADLLEIDGANPFRVRAYRRAAATVENLGRDITPMTSSPAGLAALDALPGIGEDLAGKIAEVCRSGRLSALETIEARLPASLVALNDLPGLGPARIRRLRETLGVESAAALRSALAAGALGDLPDFAPSVVRRLARALDAAPVTTRWPRAAAALEAAKLVRAVRDLPGVSRAMVAGSLRRGRPDVGDIDLVAAASPDAPVTAAFAALPEIAEVMACGSRRATVRLWDGLQVDLLVVPPESFGAALIHFTGSKPHNISLRRRAQRLGLKLNEYGLFSGRRRLAGRTEREVYEALGLPYRPPTRREGLVPMAPAHLDGDQGARV